MATYGFFGAVEGPDGERRHRWILLLHLGTLDTEKTQEILTWAGKDLLPSLLPSLERAPAPLWPITLEWVPPKGS